MSRASTHNVAIRAARAAAIVLALAALGITAGTGTAVTAPAEPGSVLAFGSNVFGQLGTATHADTITPNPSPLRLAAPLGGGSVVQVAAGTGHTLLVTSSGKLFGVGTNALGQLGVSPASTALTTDPTPIVLPGAIGGVAQTAAGAGYSLALTSSGQLYAFGNNQYGQLGITTNSGATTPNPTPTLVTLPGQVGRITEIAAGFGHSLVLTSSGQLYAFGHNQFGQLGSTTNNGTATATPKPTLVALPGQIGAIVHVAAGGYHSLALTASGQLYAFGWNSDGQLGNDTGIGTQMANSTPALVTLPGQAGLVTQIAAGAYHSLATTASGQLYAFGSDEYGQLGNDTNGNLDRPNPVPALVGLAGEVGSITQIAGGDDDTLVVTSSGQLYAFGENQYGQLGTATNSGETSANATPTLVKFPAGTTIDTVARGPVAFHTLALVSNLAIATDTLTAAQVGAPYRLPVQASGGTKPLSWSATGLPTGLTIDPAAGVISGTPTALGTSAAVITVTDAYGNSASRTERLIVATTPPPSASATGAPRLSALKQSAGRWAAGTKLARLVTTVAKTPRKHGLPIGTTFSFNLDQAASVTLTFRHTVQGRTVSGKCAAKTKGNAGKRHCARAVTDGSLHVQAPAGNDKLRFEGLVSAARKLKSAHYSVLVTAKGAAGKTSPAQSRSFTIASS